MSNHNHNPFGGPFGGMASRPTGQPSQMQITVVAKADLRRVLLEASGELARLRSDALGIMAKIAQTRDAAEAGDLALRKMSLLGGPIDRDLLANQDDVVVLNAAYDALADLAARCRDIEGLPAFSPERKA